MVRGAEDADDAQGRREPVVEEVDAGEVKGAEKPKEAPR